MAVVSVVSLGNKGKTSKMGNGNNRVRLLRWVRLACKMGNQMAVILVRLVR